MTEAISSFGTLMKIGDGQATETFTTIAEVLDINGLGISLDTEDATNHSSTDGWEEVIPTILRTDPITFTIQFIPTNATHSYSTGLIGDAASRTLRNFQIVFPDAAATTWTAACYVRKVSPSAPVAGKLTADVELKPSGKPSLA
jgi:hypothetical protein